MFILKLLKRVVGKMDLFSSIQLLRFDGDAETKTLTGGVFSLAVVIYLISTFSSMVFDTFNKLIIASTSDTIQSNEPEPVYLLTTDNASHFMLGVEVWHFDLNTGPRYFDVELRNSFMTDGVPGEDSVVYTMEPCTKQHWGSIPNGSEIYDKVGMNTWLCMPLNVTPVLKGKYYSDLQTTLDISIKKCNNDSDPARPCASQQEIDAYLFANGPTYLTIFFVNPLLNPQNKDYLKLYLEDKYYIMFGVDYGMEMYIYNAAYEITTDQSILPFTQSHYQNGSIVTSVSTNSYQMGNSSDIYGFVSFFRDPGTITVSRSFQKVIDAFAYVGGLLGSFLLVLIFVNFYNECSYEMRFASMYKVEKDCPTTAKKFNIGYYFLQSVYSLLKTVKVKCQKWKAVKYFHETREEMVRQLDVKYLFKKLNILQNAIMLLLTKPQLKGLMLQHEMTVNEAKKMRRIYALKSQVKKLFRQKLKKIQQEKDKKQEVNFKTMTEMFPEGNKHSQNSVGNQFFQNKNKQVESPTKLPFPPLKRIQTTYLSSSQSESQESSSQQEESEKIEEKIIENLIELKRQAQKNKTSAIIFENLDPLVKQFFQNSPMGNQLRDENEISKDFLYSEMQNTQQVFLIDKKATQLVQMRRTKVKPKFKERQQNIKEQQSQKKSSGFSFLQE